MRCHIHDDGPPKFDVKQSKVNRIRAQDADPSVFDGKRTGPKPKPPVFGQTRMIYRSRDDATGRFEK